MDTKEIDIECDEQFVGWSQVRRTFIVPKDFDENDIQQLTDAVRGIIGELIDQELIQDYSDGYELTNKIDNLKVVQNHDLDNSQVARHHQNELGNLTWLETFETHANPERQNFVETALFEFMKQSDFSYQDINSYESFWNPLKTEHADLRIAGRDLPTKVLAMAITNYMKAQPYTDELLSESVNAINKQYQSVFSLDEDYFGLSDHHNNKLGVRVLSAAPLIDEDQKIFKLIIEDPSLSHLVISATHELSSIDDLYEELTEFHNATPAQLAFARSEIIDWVVNLDWNDGISGVYTSDAIISRVESLFPEFDQNLTPSLK